MQKITPILLLLLVAAVIILYVDRYAGSQNPNTATAPDTTAAEFNQGKMGAARIGYIRYDSLVQGYEYHQELLSKLEAEARALRQDLDQKSQAFQENVTVLREQAGQLNQQQLQQAQQELQAKQQQLMQYRNERSQVLAEQQEKLTQLLRDDLTVVLDSIRQARKLDFILTKDRSSDVLSARPAYDITETVVKALNQNYERPDSVRIDTANLP